MAAEESVRASGDESPARPARDPAAGDHAPAAAEVEAAQVEAAQVEGPQVEGVEVAPGPERPLDRRRRRRRPWRELPAIVVLVVAAAGLGYVLVVPQHWLRGVLVFAGAMGLGGALRLVLPDRYAGLLSVRNRWFDALCFGSLAAAMIVLGLWLRSIGAT